MIVPDRTIVPKKGSDAGYQKVLITYYYFDVQSYKSKNMLLNYLKTAFRNLLKNRIFSLITVLGLAGGLTCAMLILTFVMDEVSYDQFHSKRDKVYRLRYKIQNFDIARVPPVFRDNVDSFFPEVIATSRLWSRSVSVQVPQADGSIKRFEEDNVNFADSDLKEIFDFEVLAGNLSQGLESPGKVILNAELAEKYFEGSEPIGRTILLEGNQSFEVVAVVADFPSNSHVHFDMLLPYENMYDLEPEALREGIRNNFKQNWMVSHSPTYVLLNDPKDAVLVNEKFEAFVAEKIPDNQNKGQSFELQPLLDIHLNDDVQAQSEPPGSRSFLYIFIAVGLLTLVIACINFVNLSTARSLERTREIGMRKVLGAGKSSLVYQFLGESFMTTIIASFLAVWATILLLPQLNALTGKALEIGLLITPQIVIGFFLITVVTGLLAGLYPAFFVTKVSPLNSMKGVSSNKISGSLSFRKGLVVVQFGISIMLIASTLIVFDQLNLLRNSPLGFNKDFMITVPIQSANFNAVFGGVDGEKRQKMNAFEEELASVPGVRGSTVSSIAPGFGMVNRNVIPDGFTAEDNIISPVMSIDYDFIETYEIPLIAGRDFSKEYGTDHQSAFILNEKALEDYNFGLPEEALGRDIWMEGKEGKVIGVVKDFNFLNLSQAMQPLLLEVSVAQFSIFSIKLQHQNVPQTLATIEEIWADFFPQETFDYSFLDESLAQSYQAQEQFGTLIGYFALLAIIISCMGSYGLIMFVASQKRKEVGVRKVLGASVRQVIFLLSKRFVQLVLVAIVLAIPLTLYIANLWLDDFSYRVDISPNSFLIAAFSTLMLVLLTVSYQAIKAAIANPVNALRSE